MMTAMMSEDALEILTNEFLSLNDEFFDKRKRKDVTHPYLSDRQFDARQIREISLSNLSNKQKSKVPKFGDGLTYDKE